MIEFRDRVESFTVIEFLAQTQIEQEEQRWRDVLEILLAIINSSKDISVLD